MCGYEPPSGWNLPPGIEHDQIPRHQLPRGNLPLFSFPDHNRLQLRHPF